MSRRSSLAGGVALALCGTMGSSSCALASGRVATLAKLARDRGMRFGTAISAEVISDRQIAALVAEQCEVLTPENAMKWKWFEPVEGNIDDREARTIARFARRNDMELRGHCFVWNNDNRLPGWLLEKEAELSERGGSGLVKKMQQHARRLDRRFSGIRSWDVVNEAIEPETGELRSSILSRALGEQHLDLAFDIMRDRFPKAQLVYNDSMTWGSQSAHRTGVLRLLDRALSRGVPVNALGIQSHLAKTIGRPVFEREWYDFLREVQAMGLAVLITELDCGDRAIPEADTARRDLEIAAFTRRYLDLTLSFRNVSEVVLWSMSDRTSYMNRPSFPSHRRRGDELPMRGHPYDEELRPKPMHDALVNALVSAPMR